jgi:hypothetical protein
MRNALTATLDRTAKQTPLVTLCGLPGEYADLTPAQLRTLAATLQRIAADAEAHPMTGRHYMPKRVSYPLNPA